MMSLGVSSLHFQFAYIKVLPFPFFVLQEVGSIIGKKGEIVKRFRDEVRKLGNASIENWEVPNSVKLSF